MRLIKTAVLYIIKFKSGVGVWSAPINERKTNVENVTCTCPRPGDDTVK